MAQNIMAATSALPQLVKSVSILRQAIVITGNPTGGTYTITVGIGAGSATTAAIAYNANAAAIQSALTALALVGAGNVTVAGTGTTADPFVIVFAQSFATQGVATLFPTLALSGGTNPNLIVTSAGSQAVYTVSASTTFKVAKLSVVNTGASGTTCGVSVTPAGQTAAQVVPAIFPIGAGDSLPDAVAGMFLGPGDALSITPGPSSFDIALSGVVFS